MPSAASVRVKSLGLNSERNRSGGYRHRGDALNTGARPGTSQKVVNWGFLGGSVLSMPGARVQSLVLILVEELKSHKGLPWESSG